MTTAPIMAMRIDTVNYRFHDWHFDGVRHLLVHGHKFLHIVGHMLLNGVWHFLDHRIRHDFLNRNRDFLNHWYSVWPRNGYMYWVCLWLRHQHWMRNLNVHWTLN